MSNVEHPKHYGGDTPYEVIKVIRAWGLMENACRFNALKYLARAGKKGDLLEDLEKARFYLDYEITMLKQEKAKAEAEAQAKKDNATDAPLPASGDNA